MPFYDPLKFDICMHFALNDLLSETDLHCICKSVLLAVSCSYTLLYLS